jgi:electron transport complex protein RnfC
MNPLDLLASRRSTFRRGVHPSEEKALSEDAAIEVLPTPKEVRVPVLQHIGATCESVVKPRQEVAMGDLLAESDAFVSAPVHSSIAGKTARESVTTLPNGRHVLTIPVKAGEQELEGQALYDDVLGGEWRLEEIEKYGPDDIVASVKTAGIVGMGGAAFPTYVKLSTSDERPVDTVLVNGCECEPFLTADYRVMVEAPEPVVAGALLAGRAVGAKRVVIGIEDNKPLAAERLRQAASGTDLEVVVVPTKYPQGAEKQLVFATLGRVVPAGGLPLDVGVVVVNVETSAAIARAVLRGKSFTHRVITITGRGVERPLNVLAPVGVSYKVLLEAAGGLTADARRVLAGGPMMGFCIGSLDTPVTKGTGAVTVLTEADMAASEETACIRCGRCVDVCPLGLVPTKIAVASRHREWDLAARYYIKDCMECGCCAFACPAQIPLVQLIRMGKAEMAA